MDFIIRMAMSPFIDKYITARIDWEDKQNTVFLFSAFATVQIFVLLVYGLIYLKVSKADDTIKNVKVEKQPQMNFSAMMSGNMPQGEPVMKTRREYDMDTLMSMLKGLPLGIGFTLFIYSRSHKPGGIILQCIFGPFSLIRSNLFKAYILGQDLPRPFPASGPLQMLQQPMQQMQQQIAEQQAQMGTNGSQSRAAFGTAVSASNTELPVTQEKPTVAEGKKKKKTSKVEEAKKKNKSHDSSDEGEKESEKDVSEEKEREQEQEEMIKVRKVKGKKKKKKVKSVVGDEDNENNNL